MTNQVPASARILVVDDNRQIVDVLRLGLMACGFEVLTATDGRQAIECATRSLPDLILLDVMMPVLGGHAVCETLKSEPSTRDIPIIFLSACTDVPDRVLGLELGAVDYVTKPFDMDEVASRVRAALRTRARQDERSRDLDRMKSDFLHLLTHEIATPLTAIQGFSELLEMGLSHMTPHTQMDCLRAINQSSRRLTGTLDDFLCLAQAARIAPAGSTDLARIVHEQVEEFTADFRDRHVAFQVAVEDADLSPVPAHPRFLPRAVYHLLSNAAKFSPPGSTILVRMAPQGSQVVMEVHDPGPGIPAPLEERIFERFYQADSSRTRVHAGMGIGLTVARTVARALGGDVTLVRSSAAGSVFSLTLPSRSSASSEAQDALPA